MVDLGLLVWTKNYQASICLTWLPTKRVNERFTPMDSDDERSLTLFAASQQRTLPMGSEFTGELEHDILANAASQEVP